MIWTLKKLVARRSARKATAPESEPAVEERLQQPDSTSGQSVAPEVPVSNDPDESAATERAGAVESAEQAALSEDAVEGAQPGGDAAGTPEAGPAADDTSGKEAADQQTSSEDQQPAKPAKRRRAPKLDPLLAADTGTARTAILEVAPEEEVGGHASVKAEDDRVVTHLFESNIRGYKGWQWFAVLARVPRGKVATVSEVGLLPSDRSVLAPKWIPWAERVRPEEKKQAEAEEAEAEKAGAEQGGVEAKAATGSGKDQSGNGGSGQ